MIKLPTVIAHGQASSVANTTVVTAPTTGVKGISAIDIVNEHTDVCKCNLIFNDNGTRTKLLSTRDRVVGEEFGYDAGFVLKPNQSIELWGSVTGVLDFVVKGQAEYTPSDNTEV